MIRELAVVGVTLAYVLAAQAESKERAQVTKTERINFIPKGSLRLENSIGDVTIEGWDQSDVEITTTRSMYTVSHREDESRKLDHVKVSAERRGAEIVLTTDFPRYRTMPPPLPWRGTGDFDLEYRIHVPRGTRLVISHNTGEVHVNDISDDIDVRVLRGLIALSLPQEGQYDIDAKTDLGSVVSDFPGRSHRRLWLFGNRLKQATTAGAKLHLRIGYGDIEILKISKPPAPTAQGQ